MTEEQVPFGGATKGGLENLSLIILLQTQFPGVSPRIKIIVDANLRDCGRFSADMKW